MKKCISLLFILIAFKVQAQDDLRPGFVFGFYGGLSIPLGDFGDKNLSDWDNHCGCAKVNGAIGFKMKSRLKGGLIGIAGIQNTRNAYDPKPIAQALNTAFDAPFSVETDSWKSQMFQLGVGYQFLLNKNEDLPITFSIEASGLLNTIETYFFRIQSPDGSNRYPLLQKSVSDSDIGYSLGASFLIDLGGWGFQLSGDYLKVQHSIDDADRRYNGGDLIPQVYDQKFEVFTIQVGVLLIGGGGFFGL